MDTTSDGYTPWQHPRKHGRLLSVLVNSRATPCCSYWIRAIPAPTTHSLSRSLCLLSHISTVGDNAQGAGLIFFPTSPCKGDWALWPSAPCAPLTPIQPPWGMAYEWPPHKPFSRSLWPHELSKSYSVCAPPSNTFHVHPTTHLCILLCSTYVYSDPLIRNHQTCFLNTWKDTR